MNNHRANCWLSLVLLLPLGQPDSSHEVKFKMIVPNRIEFATNSIILRVENSASALVSSFRNAVGVTRLHVKGRVQGQWRHIGESRSGRSDDMILRVGLVESGSRRLNFVEKRVAPDWLKELFRLRPEHSGIAKVHFFNVSARRAAEELELPRSQQKLVAERVVATPDGGGRFEFNCTLPQTIKVIAVWLGADGDDSHSSFVVTVERVEIECDTKTTFKVPGRKSRPE